MQKRLALFNALADAIEQQPAIGVQRLIRNRSCPVAEEALPLAHVFWSADRKTAEKAGKARRELSLVVEIYAIGDDRGKQAETLEDAVCTALLTPDPRQFDVVEIDGPDADNDEDAAWEEFCQARLTFTVTYIAEGYRLFS